MTLNEAIEHLEDLLKNKEFSCESCKEEHEQLLIWLKELRTLKGEKFMNSGEALNAVKNDKN